MIPGWFLWFYGSYTSWAPDARSETLNTHQKVPALSVSCLAPRSRLLLLAGLLWSSSYKKRFLFDWASRYSHLQTWCLFSLGCEWMNESQGKVQCAVQAQAHNILLLPKKCTPAHMHTIQAQKHAAMCTAHRKITHTEATTWRKTAGLQSKNKIQIHRYTGPAFHRCLIFFHMRMRKR